MRIGNGRNGATIGVNEDKAAGHENQEGKQLGNCEKVADPCSHDHAANVCERKSPDQNGKDHKTVDRFLCLRPEPRHVIDKDVSNCGRRANPRQPEKPSSLQSQKTTKGDFCVKIRASGLVKARRNLGNTSGNYADSCCCNQVSSGTSTS